MFISSCDSVLRDSLLFHQEIEVPYMLDWEYWFALHAMQLNRASYPGEGDVSWPFSSCGRNLGYILELQRGWPFETPLFSAKSGLLSSYDGHLRNLNYDWQDNMDASGGEAGDRGTLSSWNSDIWIPIHFQKESGFVTF